MKHENMALLTTMDNHNMQADALRGLLETCGIPSHAVSTLTNDVSQFYLGQSFKDRFAYEIYVPESRLEEAREIMDAPVAYDWPEEYHPEPDDDHPGSASNDLSHSERSATEPPLQGGDGEDNI